jgi:hypothetical protein
VHCGHVRPVQPAHILFVCIQLFSKDAGATLAAAPSKASESSVEAAQHVELFPQGVRSPLSQIPARPTTLTQRLTHTPSQDIIVMVVRPACTAVPRPRDRPVLSPWAAGVGVKGLLYAWDVQVQELQAQM